MQNDLISRSTLIEELEKELGKCKEVNFMSVWSKAMQIVENKPTAYSVEKVVAELEEKRRYAFNVVYKEAMTKAIDVVRNGGKE